MKKPNAFIIGAPKSGTTAMAYYLSKHPQIFMSHIKEPHYFIRKDMPRMSIFSEDEYLELFREAGDEHRIVMEASVWYLYGENAIKEIKEFDSGAKLIVMLRRPDEMVYSMHNQNYVSRNEDVKDFSRAWSLIDQRRKGENVPKHCRDIKLLEYDKVAAYYSQLARVYRAYDKEKVKVVFFEDFKADVDSVYREILEFLGVDNVSLPVYEVVNENKTIKSVFFANLITRPPKFVLFAAKKFRNLLGIKAIGIRDYLKSKNEKVEGRQPLSEEMKNTINECYKAEITGLEDLMGVDLSHWYGR